MKLKPKRLVELTKLPPPPFLFQDFIRDKSVTQIAADPYTGKSMLMLYMALCLDYQLPLFGKFAALRPHKVLYIGPDSPEWDYGGQTLKIMRGMGLTPAAREMCGVDIHTHQDIDITNAELLQSIEDYWQEEHFTVLFIDTLLDVHPYNPNDAQMMKLVMKTLKGLRDRYGCAVVFANHIPKFTGVERVNIQQHAGSFKIAGSSDFQLLLKKKAQRVYLGWGKQRGQMGEEPLKYFELIDVEVIEENIPTWGVRFDVPALDRNSVVLDTILTGGYTTRHIAAAAIKAKLPGADGKPLTDAQSLKAADNALQALRSLGKIKKEDTGKWVLLKA